MLYADVYLYEIFCIAAVKPLFNMLLVRDMKKHGTTILTCDIVRLRDKNIVPETLDKNLLCIKE